MLRTMIWLLLPLAVACSSKKTETAGTQPNASMSIPVQYVVAGKDTTTTELKLTGSVLANESIELHTEISGRITAIYFKEGESVTQGKVLVMLNNEDLLAQAKKLDLNIQLAKTNEDRQLKMLNIKAISQEEYDGVANQLNTLLAEKEILQAQINKTYIKAPFNGVVGLRQVSVGSIVSPTTILANFTQLNPVKIEFAVSDKYAGRLKKGDKVSIAYGNDPTTYTATIYALDNEVDVVSRSLKIRALADNRSGKWVPGSFVLVELPLSMNTNSIMLPSEVIIPEMNRQKVLTVQGGRVASKSIQVGQRYASGVEILGGLSAGDTIIATGLLQLKDSMMVVPKVPYRP